MNIVIRIFIVLVTAVVVFAAMNYVIQALDITVGSLKYCFIIGFGVAFVLFVWSLTGLKNQPPSQSD